MPRIMPECGGIFVGSGWPASKMDRSSFTGASTDALSIAGFGISVSSRASIFQRKGATSRVLTVHPTLSQTGLAWPVDRSYTDDRNIRLFQPYAPQGGNACLIQLKRPKCCLSVPQEPLAATALLRQRMRGCNPGLWCVILPKPKNCLQISS